MNGVRRIILKETYSNLFEKLSKPQEFNSNFGIKKI